VTGFLLDTNVVSEFRRRERIDQNVRGWVGAHADDEMWLSVLVVGELRRGVELVMRRDPVGVEPLHAWLTTVVEEFGDRVLPVTTPICLRWAGLSITEPVPVVDGLLAATALEHGLTLATRNVADVARTGVSFVNPFEPA